MTELEKFIQLFNEIGIEYKKEEFWGNTIILSIDNRHIMKTYDNFIDIEFNSDSGKFIRFVAHGGD